MIVLTKKNTRIRRMLPALACLAALLLPPAAGATGEVPGLSHLSLRQAEALFVQHSHELAQARQAVEGARADVLAANARPNPTLSLNTASINPHNGLGSGPFWQKQMDSTVRIDQVFERGNKRALRRQAAELAADATRDDLQDTLRTQRIAFDNAFYDLLAAQEKQQIAIETAALYGKTLHAALLRLSAGDIAEADVTRIRVDALKAENDARQARADRQVAQQALAYYLGADAQADQLQAEDRWPTLHDLAPARVDDLVAARADVRAAQTRLAAAGRRRDLARAQRIRDLDIGVQYEHYPPDASNTFGAGISFPLFTNYQFQGEIHRAESDYLAARLNLDQVRAAALADIRKTQAQFNSARDRYRRYQEDLLANARKAAHAAEFAYSHGAMGVMDLLDARRTLYATRQDAVTASADYAKALAAWRVYLSQQDAQP